MTINYLKEGIEAKGHSAAYKTHKYFARRPHNVFQHIIETYSSPGDIVLDPFCGGGVTLVEGLSLGRRVIATDVNPLATFITQSETTVVPLNEYDELTTRILNEFKAIVDQHYATECRNCGRNVPVEWYELAYKIQCPKCTNSTLLSNQNKSKNGFYICSSCDHVFPAVDQKKLGYELIKVAYRCLCLKERQTVSPIDSDINKMLYFEESFDKLIKKYDLWYPNDVIPEFWDRQQEDCLYRKSIYKFSDFYTKRALFFNAYFLKLIQGYKKNTSDETYQLLIFLFSSVIRYTNNMTFSASNWMDGRPIAWDKHAYWIPNQFVEVNPIGYVEKRKKAILASLKSQNSNLKETKLVNTFKELESKKGTHILWNVSSSKLDIPDDSIDAVITDPPYGSNVQYGELSHYWLVWLQKDVLLKDKLFNLNEEILVNRKKTTANFKDYNKYYNDLLAVYSECFRVLKPGRVMVFTFNNKELKTWYSMIKAVTRSGFDLEPQGIIYQDSIENYKNTAHNRFEGTLLGDFIYSFVKTNKANGVQYPNLSKNEIIIRIKNLISLKSESHGNLGSVSQDYMNLVKKLTPLMIELARVDVAVDSLPQELVKFWNTESN